MHTPILPSRLRGALLSHATIDALGAPVEFKPRHSFPLHITMTINENFCLPPGCFTDDTSMALCLAHSLLDNGPADYADQAKRYIRWWRTGYCSSTGSCFDIGMGTMGALGVWEGVLGVVDGVLGLEDGNEEGMRERRKKEREGLKQIEKGWSDELDCGNGTLMRVLPVALMYEGVEAERVAVQVGRVTHPHERCGLCCALFVRCVGMALKGLGKIEIAEAVGAFVEEARGTEGLEGVFVQRFGGYKGVENWEARQESDISSSGYVLDSLEAALWAFFTTSSLREGAIKVVNLGDDADTVGAIYGGLAGAFYGSEAIPQEWLGEMKGLAMVNEVAEKIVAFRTAPVRGFTQSRATARHMSDLERYRMYGEPMTPKELIWTLKK